MYSSKTAQRDKGVSFTVYIRLSLDDQLLTFPPDLAIIQMG